MKLINTKNNNRYCQGLKFTIIKLVVSVDQINVFKEQQGSGIILNRCLFVTVDTNILSADVRERNMSRL